MKQNVNFIKHYLNVNSKLFEEDTFNATHVSLYNALFQMWNNCGYEKNLSINRNDVMNLSKIGSANTYLKCLKELHDKKYIKYKPSKNPLKGSVINLYRFDTSSDIVVNKYSTSSDTSSGTSSDTLYKLLNYKTIKHIEDNYMLVNENIERWIKDPMQGSMQGSMQDPLIQEKEKEKEEYTIPTLEEFKNYALEKEPLLNENDLKLKYLSWKENNWKDGNDKVIKNWKSKLLNTIPYMAKTGHKNSHLVDENYNIKWRPVQ